MNLSIFCPFPKTLREAELKGNGLINKAGEISREPSTRAVALILLIAFSRVYSTENYEQKGEGKGFLKRAVFPEKKYV